jgi:tetratricopeptide (TPR) repeat protein/tRNA A-37 threonylcarbamoyl transferase component Bud32
MGQVYAAEDTLLKRRVAVKRMAPSLQFDERDRVRFLKEAQRASTLSHANVAAIYDVVEDKGEILIIMEYIEGTTLRSRCGKPMSTEQFLDIAQQCADGLSAAHAQHILHGDIKPENIMLTAAGRVKILDFGVAKRFTVAGADDATQSLATLEGVTSGTPAYMAPEVLTQKPYDGRADLFSLGLVFYEMLGGAQPFMADSFVEIVGHVLHTGVPPITQVNKNVPMPIAQVVTSLLQKNPADRYASANDLLADLRAVQQTGAVRFATASANTARRGLLGKRLWVTAGGLVLLVIVAVLLAYKPARDLLHLWRPTATAETQALPQTPILAVLPFKAIEGNPKLTALGEGLVESVAAKLGQLGQSRSLEIITARNLQDKHVSSLSEARNLFGANLGVTIALEQAGELTHASYSVTDARDGRVIAGESITVPTTDVFSVEDNIAQGTVRALQLTLRSEEQRALKLHGTTQAAAYGYYLQARGYLVDYSQTENVENAIVMAKNALKLDAAFGRAKAALGEAYWRKYSLTKEKKWTDQARSECDSAVKSGNAGEAGHICLGLVNDGTGQYRAAANEYQRAVELEPTNESAALGLALAFEHQGSVDEAEKAYLRAIDAHPQSYFTHNALGAFYYRRSELDKAAGMFERVTQLAPEGYVGYLNLGGALVEQGKYAEAVAPLKRSIALRPTYGAYANLGNTYFTSARFAEAAAAYREAAKLDPKQYVTWGNLGAALFYGGNKDEARRVYQKALDIASEQLKVNPRDTDVLSDICEYYAMMGDREHAQQYLGQALQYGHNEKELLFTAAQVYNDLGETGLALEWLSKAVQAGYSPTKFRDYPAFKNLADNPQFRQMVGH